MLLEQIAKPLTAADEVPEAVWTDDRQLAFSPSFFATPSLITTVCRRRRFRTRAPCGHAPKMRT
ncbi:hypothetical protein Sinac_3856 [Singulisphaera acidiphila DSM 18658]|uniref:Uncharacterized protein n=1 Tax=Singulisphaera acidiphila (strain ATCC BAA-1392 / DSM 18658 / VKM B-2454 / MOB10) TaxID=886293 RepID=L0DHD8_SINAD|nr:hypothetical protein Sinac_3856 [Singulisphaera acidiphila DSM 18658]